MATEITESGDMRIIVNGCDVTLWYGGETPDTKNQHQKIWVHLNLPPALTREQMRRKAGYERRYANGR